MRCGICFARALADSHDSSMFRIAAVSFVVNRRFLGGALASAFSTAASTISESPTISIVTGEILFFGSPIG
jgi:hypothetical protein